MQTFHSLNVFRSITNLEIFSLLRDVFVKKSKFVLTGAIVTELRFDICLYCAFRTDTRNHLTMYFV